VALLRKSFFTAEVSRVRVGYAHPYSTGEKTIYATRPRAVLKATSWLQQECALVQEEDFFGEK